MTKLSVGDQLLQAQRVAEMILTAAAQAGIVAEITIQPGQHTRFLNMSKALQAELAEIKPPTVETYLAALEYAGETVSELTKLRIEQALRRAGKVSTKGVPTLVDTPDARADALRAMGIEV